MSTRPQKDAYKNVDKKTMQKLILEELKSNYNHTSYSLSKHFKKAESTIIGRLSELKKEGFIEHRTFKIYVINGSVIKRSRVFPVLSEERQRRLKDEERRKYVSGIIRKFNQLTDDEKKMGSDIYI